MEITVRYENQKQTISLTSEETENLWVSLSLGNDAGLSDEEKSKTLQDAFDERFNKPDYNNWHRHRSHWGTPKGEYEDDDDARADVSDAFREPRMDEIRDERLFLKDELERDREYAHEALREKIRANVKPAAYADILIAVYIDGLDYKEYAEDIGKSANTVNHLLHRAEEKLKKVLEKCPFLASPTAIK